MTTRKGPRPAVNCEPLEPRAYLAAGDLDLTFGNGGKVLPASNADFAQEVALQSDGKFVVAGRTIHGDKHGYAVARYQPDGSLDSTFGVDGKTILQTPQGYVAGLAIQPDGKILIAGGADLDFLILRLNPDGSPDLSFSGDGAVSVDFASLTDNPFALALRPDGRILVAGSASLQLGSCDFGLVQLRPDGSPDPTFGNDGKSILGAGSQFDEIHDLALQPDGRIVAAAATRTSSNYNWTLARINADGKAFDQSFGDAGLVFGDGTRSNVVRLLKRGRILVGGSGPDGSTFMAARYHGNGQLDNSFGTAGVTRVGFGTKDAGVNDLITQKAGGIVLVGSAGKFDSDPTKRWQNFAATRLTGDGKLDTSFGRRGKVAVSFHPTADVAHAAILLPKSRILVAGSHDIGEATDLGPADFQITRLTPAGHLDTAFATAGRLTTDFTSPAETRATDIARLPDGSSIVLFAHESVTDRIGVSRFDAGGALDTSFGDNGTVLLDFGAENNRPEGLALQPGGRIAVTGTISGSNFGRAIGVALLEPDGTPVSTFGANGLITHRNPRNPSAGAAAFQGDQLLVTGSTAEGTFLVRFNADGSPDPTFGNAGVAQNPSGGIAHVMAIQPDGKPVIVGHRAGAPGEGYAFAAARFTRGGQLDNTFGDAGTATISFHDGPHLEIPRSAAIDSAGNIVLAGVATRDVPGEASAQNNFAVARLRPDGSPDPYFGGGDGKVIIPFGIGHNGGAAAVLIQRDDKIILVGNASSNGAADGNSDLALVRLKPDGSLDTSFGGDGTILTPMPDSQAATAATLLNNGQILVAGGSDGQLLLTRFHNDQQQIHAQVTNGNLVITGTAGDDQIVLGREFDGPLRILGIPFSSTTQPPFSGILIRGFGGNDWLSAEGLSSQNGLMHSPWPAPVTIQGGAGDDLLVGGPGKDSLLGDDGHDTLLGAAGDDRLFSDDTYRDRLDGGPGLDRNDSDGRDALVNLEGTL